MTRFIYALLSFVIVSFTSAEDTFYAESHPTYPGLEAYEEWLADYVSDDGMVDYRRAQSERQDLRPIIHQWALLQPSAMDTVTSMTYWINLYNALTVQLILDHYPVKRIKDIDAGAPWDQPRIVIEGEDLSLNDIEHDILRARYQDARIHFAVNCAAKSCPPLLSTAYRPEQLEAQLERQTRAYINDDAHNQVSTGGLELSAIFSWYESDFKPDVSSFIQQYAEQAVSPDSEITYLDYDWSLNE